MSLTHNAFSAGSSGDGDPSEKISNYTKAHNLIKSAKKYEKKDKIKKAQKNYSKAQKLLLKSNWKNLLKQILWTI